MKFLAHHVQQPQHAYRVQAVQASPATAFFATALRARRLGMFAACSLAVGLGSLAMAQSVGVGTASPAASAILDVSSSSKGTLLPRVALTSSTDQTTIPSPATGLVVFNTGTAGLNSAGFVYWSGTEWRMLTSASTAAPSATLDCPAASIDPSTLVAGTPYAGYLRVPYTAGNGGKFPAGTAIASSGNTGLNANLLDGTLNYGSGTLVYQLSGTPLLSNPNGASFALSFGGSSCTATVGNVSGAKIDQLAAFGGLIPTTDNGVTGWSQMLTTPDGKFSIRAFIAKRSASFANDRNYGAANLQIRSNGAARTVAWIHSFDYNAGVFNGAGSTATSFSADTWSGMAASAATAVAISAAAPEVYVREQYADAAPEDRKLVFVDTAAGSKTYYRVTWTFIGPANANYATAVTTDALALDTKNTLMVTQITGQ